MSANFNFYLNRQGIKGRKGDKGDDGFSPLISVNTETASEYILAIQNEDGTFLTPNLRGNAIDNQGGTYIRYNPDTEQMYTGYADAATTEQPGQVQIGTYENLQNGDNEDVVPNSMDVHDYIEEKIETASGGFVSLTTYNNFVNDTEADILALQTNKANASDVSEAISNLSSSKLDASTFNSYVTNTAQTLNTLSTTKLDFNGLVNSLEEGNNITLSVDSTTGKIIISATGGGGGGGTQVQADWNETDPTDPSYILNKPTIPSVGNGTITLTQGGATKGTFTTNQSGNTSINLDIGVKSATITDMVQISQSDYDDLVLNDEVDANTFYIII